MSYDVTVTGTDPLVLSLASGEMVTGAEAVGLTPRMGERGLLRIDNHRPIYERHPAADDLLPGELSEQDAATLANASEGLSALQVLASELEAADAQAAENATRALDLRDQRIDSAEGEIQRVEGEMSAIAQDATQALQAAGAAMTGQTIEYALAGSATVPPESGWSTTMPSRPVGQYLWRRVAILYGDDTMAMTAPEMVTGDRGDEGPPGADGTSVTITGSVPTAADLPTGLGPADAGKGWIAEDDGHLHVWSGSSWTDVGQIKGGDGSDGAPGRGVSGGAVAYQLGANGTTPPTGSWLGNPPIQTAALPYLWTRTTIAYTSGDPTVVYSVSRRGDKGDTGTGISAVRPYFRLLPEGSSAPATPSGASPSGWSTTEPTYAPGQELWQSDRITWTTGGYSWTTPRKSSAWAAAVHVGNLSHAAIQGLVKVSATDPGHYPGRIWWQIGDYGELKGLYFSTGSLWTKYMLVGHDMVAANSITAPLVVASEQLSAKVGNFLSVTAGTIQAGALDGAVVSGMLIKGLAAIIGPEDGDRVELGSSSMRVVRRTAENQDQTTTMIGGPSADQMMLYRDGQPMSGFLSDGSAVVGGDITVGGDLTVGALGQSLAEVLGSRPKPLAWYVGKPSLSVGSGEVGFIRFDDIGPILRGRVYRIVVKTQARAHTAGDRLYMQLRGQDQPGPATIFSDVMANQVLPLIGSAALQYQPVEFEHFFTDTWPNDVQRASFLVAAYNYSENRRIDLGSTAKHTYAYVEDWGPADVMSEGIVTTAGGTPWGGSTPPPQPPAKQTYTKFYTAMETRHFGPGVSDSPENLHHGYWTPGQRYSWIRFHPASGTDTVGATIKSVKIHMQNTHTFNGVSMVARIGITHNANPSSVPTGTNPVQVTWGHGVRASVDITASGYVPGQVGCVVLGEGAGTSTSRWGKFNGRMTMPDGSLHPMRPILEITYEK